MPCDGQCGGGIRRQAYAVAAHKSYTGIAGFARINHLHVVRVLQERTLWCKRGLHLHAAAVPLITLH